MFGDRQTVLPLYRPIDEPSTLRTIAGIGGKIALAIAYGALVVVLPQTYLFVLALPIVILLLLTLWMMPDRETYPLQSILRVFSFYLVLSVLWPGYLAVNVPGLPWVTPTRLLLFALIALLLFSVSTSGGLRSHLARVATGSTPLWVAFLIWELMQVVTLPLSGAVSISLKKLIDNQFELVGMFFLGCLVFSRPGWAKWASSVLIILTAICCVDGFIELSMGAPPWSGHIPSFLKVDDATLANVLGTQARAGDGIYRVRGPFSNSGILAEYLAVCMPFIIHWLVSGRSLVLRLLLASCWIIVLWGILLTNSRLGLVGALVVHLVYLPLWGYRRWKADTGTMFGPAVLVGGPLAAILLVALIFSSTTLKRRVIGGEAQAASTESRRIQLDMAIPKILANPIGHGLATSGNVLNFVSPNGTTTVDNHYITTALDIGVVGLLAFQGMWVIGAALAVRLYTSTTDPEIELAAPLAAMFVAFITIKSVFSQEDNHPLIFLLLGMVAALRARGIAAPDPAGDATPAMVER